MGLAEHDGEEQSMTTETVEAVYEHGGFRLVAPSHLKLAEGQKVRLVVEAVEQPEDILGLAARVYEGLTAGEIDSIEEHTRRREAFFGKRTSS
jgi:predicted DNA-binding antitoxin AbrB/MazE fold protein